MASTSINDDNLVNDSDGGFQQTLEEYIPNNPFSFKKTHYYNESQVFDDVPLPN